MDLFGLFLIGVGIIVFYAVVIIFAKFMAWGLNDENDNYYED